MGGGPNCTCGGKSPHAPGCPALGSTAPWVGVLAGNGCGPDGANAPVLDEGCTLVSDLLGVLDDVRHLETELGMTPYRAWLVWELRGPDGEFRDVRRIELQPVKVVGLREMNLDLSVGGMRPQGVIRIERVSPRQVNEDDLRGRMDGKPWDEDGQRFFVEIASRDLCGTDGRAPVQPMRFAPAGPPELRTVKSPIGWSMSLIDQSMPRGRIGEDRTAQLNAPAPTASRWSGLRST